ncbi:MAG: hypothetical protein NTY08_04940 [Proteobacteria bacterium]|nr:hypothetical protein [Pseudomonadota bacterium]
MLTSTVDFGNLTIDIQQTANEVVYKFVGEVDEHFRQKDVPRVKKANITFVLEDIATFNSCGIREWIYLVRDISELGALKFTKCSVAMIDQINMVPDSIGKGTVDSFFAPYYCNCGGEVNRLINVGDCLPLLLRKNAPEFKCEECGNKLEFDALEESYFLFAEAALPEAS